MDWTEQQTKIIHAPIGNAVVVACAGSGKTAVVVERVTELCRSRRFEPETISIITFTNLAADEVRARLTRSFDDSAIEGFPWTGTIHSFCLYHLRNFDPTFGESAVVMTEGKLFALFFKKYEDWSLAQLFEKKYPKSYVIDRLTRTMEHVVLHGVDINPYRKDFPDFTRVFDEYIKWSQENSALDYQQILASYYAHLLSSDFVTYLRGNVSCLIVDEYQDTDPLQDKIFRELSEFVPIMVVGDDDQCIYQFRGTTHENILKFTSRFKDAVSLPLAKNFRCGSNIVNAAAAVASKLPDRLPKPFEYHWTGGHIFTTIFPDVGSEAAFIANKVQALLDDGVIQDYSEVALLFRSVASTAAPYLEALANAKIPAVAYGDRSLFQRLEIRQVMSALEVIQRDELSGSDLDVVFDILNVHVDMESLEVESENIREWTKTNWKSVGLKSEQVSTVLRVLGLRRRYRDQKLTDCHTFLFEVFEALGFNEPDVHSQCHKNLAVLSGIVSDFQEVVDGKSVRMLVNYVNSYGRRKFDSAQEIDECLGAVNVLTVHQAKGLQFHAVFCPMLVDGKFPVRMAPNDLIIPVERGANGRGVINDERRLFYVAMTRAVAVLFASYPERNMTGRKCKSSPFFLELEEFAADGNDLLPSPGVSRPKESLVTSYSRIEYYLSCPYRYWLLFEAGYKTPQNPVFALGRLLHLILRLAHESHMAGKPLDDKQIQRLYEENFPDLRRLAPLARKRLARNVLRAIRKYIREKETWLSETSATELSFAYRTTVRANENNVPLEIIGQIDLVTGEPPHIIDFKSGKPHDYIRTDLQLAVYSFAYEQLMGVKPETVSVHYVEHDTTRSYTPDNNWLANFRSILEDAAKGILEQQFDPTPGEVCTRCEVRRICAYGRAT